MNKNYDFVRHLQCGPGSSFACWVHLKKTVPVFTTPCSVQMWQRDVLQSKPAAVAQKLWIQHKFICRRLQLKPQDWHCLLHWHFIALLWNHDNHDQLATKNFSFQEVCTFTENVIWSPNKCTKLSLIPLPMSPHMAKQMVKYGVCTKNLQYHSGEITSMYIECAIKTGGYILNRSLVSAWIRQQIKGVMKVKSTVSATAQLHYLLDLSKIRHHASSQAQLTRTKMLKILYYISN